MTGHVAHLINTWVDVVMFYIVAKFEDVLVNSWKIMAGEIFRTLIFLWKSVLPLKNDELAMSEM